MVSKVTYFTILDFAILHLSPSPTASQTLPGIHANDWINP
jgi:hypothetical protein